VPDPRRLPLATLLSYAPPAFALGAPIFFVQFFFLKFSTDVLLLAPATIGAIFAVSRLWDAALDPIIGTWSDRTRTRFGRRRPFMLAAIPLAAVTFLMLWSPPAALSSTATTLWVVVALYGFYAGFSAYAIPHFALGAELVDDYHDRSRVYGVRNASFMLGLLPAFGCLQLVNNASDPRAMALAVAIVGALTISGVLLIPLRVRERAEFQRGAVVGSLPAMRDVLRNPHARRILSVQFLDSLGIGVLGVLGPYLAQYVLVRRDLIAALPGVFTACLLASIPLWVWASRRFGKRQAWATAMIGMALSFGATIVVGENDVTLIIVMLVLAGLCGGCGGPIGASMLADVIDADELTTGQRKEGAYTAAFTFAFQVGSGITVAMVGFALSLSGFVPNVAQTPTVIWTMKALFAGTPFLMLLIGAAVLRRYTLDQREHERIRQGLVEARAAEVREPERVVPFASPEVEHR
jgi:GPH family glycoside/pentoside/hexuronide:cation symporter